MTFGESLHKRSSLKLIMRSNDILGPDLELGLFKADFIWKVMALWINQG